MGAPCDGEFAQTLANHGALIMTGVGKSTTLLVIDAERPFAFGVRRSATYRKAEGLIETGSIIHILSRSEIDEKIKNRSFS